jgi:lambda family phage portal protein
VAALTWVDRATAPLFPKWTAKRVRARVAMDLVQARYDAAGNSRRTSGWKRPSTDANQAQGGALAHLRFDARDLIRNNAFAESALTTIVDHVCGWGITASTKDKKAAETWKAWAETTACDADGRQNFYGIQRLVMRTTAQDGECLVRRRWRRPEDKLPIPLQLQVLEADYLDTSKDAVATLSAGWITQGIEYDAIGRRVAYWLFREHPGSAKPGAGSMQSERIPESEVLHVFDVKRPGQARGASWFALIMLRLKDLDDYLDAALIKQKVAACLAIIETDADASGVGLGVVTTGAAGEQDRDTIGPGEIIRRAAGSRIDVVQPPTVNEHAAYVETVLREIAAGLGVAYEDLTGSYVGMPYSAARMSRIRHWARVHAWRWNLLIPQLCDSVWRWAMQAAAINGLEISTTPPVEWTAQPPAMLDPTNEGLAYMRLLRIGAITWPEMIRELGEDPDAQIAEIEKWNANLDRLGIKLDSDPRYLTQGGQLQGSAASGAEAGLTAAARSAEAAIDGMIRHILAEHMASMAGNGAGH